jgi:LPS export ABC transporter protein LptC
MGVASAIMASALLFSCRNDIQEIRDLDVVDTLPVTQARDIEILYSERGRINVKLVSPLLISMDEQDNILEFPKGFLIYFYDTAMQVKSTIKADYGISREQEKIMEARYNVIVENLEKKERLNTEQLFWNRTRETIYTEKFVRITRGEEVITGDGLISDQSFEDVTITNPKGLIEVIDGEAEGPGPL